MKFTCIFYILFWPTTFSFVGTLSCHHCVHDHSLSEYNRCLVTSSTEPSFITECDDPTDLCHLRFDDITKSIVVRSCKELLLLDLDYYDLNSCVPYIANEYICVCNTNNCNNKTFPSEVASLTALKCISCPSNGPQKESCLSTGDSSHSIGCTGKGWFCATVLDYRKKIIERKCVPVGGYYQKNVYYSIGECRLLGYGDTTYYCACNTDDCNNKSSSEMDLPSKPSRTTVKSIEITTTGKPIETSDHNSNGNSKPALKELNCYNCNQKKSADCLNPTKKMLKKCPDFTGLPPGYKQRLQRLQKSLEDFYCVTEFANNIPTFRSCRKRKHLPNSADPKKCHVNDTIKFCACKTNKCNHWSSFDAEVNHVEAIKGFCIAVFTSAIVVSLL